MYMSMMVYSFPIEICYTEKKHKTSTSIMKYNVNNISGLWKPWFLCKLTIEINQVWQQLSFGVITHLGNEAWTSMP